MNVRVRAPLMLGGSMFAGTAMWAATQGQDGTPSAQTPSVHLHVHPKPKNLKVLPREMMSTS